MFDRNRTLLSLAISRMTCLNSEGAEVVNVNICQLKFRILSIESSRKPYHDVHDVSSRMVSVCVIGKSKNPGMLSHTMHRVCGTYCFNNNNHCASFLHSTTFNKSSTIFVSVFQCVIFINTEINMYLVITRMLVIIPCWHEYHKTCILLH